MSELSNGEATFETEVARLSKLSRVEYDRERQKVADRLGIRVSTLDDAVKAKLPPTEKAPGQGQTPKLPERLPWSEPVDGNQLLGEMAGLIMRYVVLPNREANAIALWVLASHALDALYIFPRLLIKSPEKGCGKSTLVDVIGSLVNIPFVASYATASALFRVIERDRPTILLDEADAYLRHNGQVRPIINAGHKKDGQVFCSVGDEHEPRAFSVWSAMVIAGIGSQADTIEDRSIIVELKRKRPDERSESFRSDRPGEDVETLARKAARWARDNLVSLSTADPAIPDGVHNRAADNWRPLLAVAEAAGGDWPELAREVASKMMGEDGSRGVQVLSAIRDIFAKVPKGPLWSNDLVKALNGYQHACWSDLDEEFTANSLASALRPFGIRPKQIRIGQLNNRGYAPDQFTEAFDRYLPVPEVTAATPLQVNSNGGISATEGATPSDDVAPPKLSAPAEILGCSGVAVSEEGTTSEEGT